MPVTPAWQPGVPSSGERRRHKSNAGHPGNAFWQNIIVSAQNTPKGRSSITGFVAGSAVFRDAGRLAEGHVQLMQCPAKCTCAHQRLHSGRDQEANTARSAEGLDSLKKSRCTSMSTGSTLLSHAHPQHLSFCLTTLRQLCHGGRAMA